MMGAGKLAFTEANTRDEGLENTGQGEQKGDQKRCIKIEDLRVSMGDGKSCIGNRGKLKAAEDWLGLWTEVAFGGACAVGIRC